MLTDHHKQGLMVSLTAHRDKYFLRHGPIAHRTF
jgi:hypothetical protein